MTHPTRMALLLLVAATLAAVTCGCGPRPAASPAGGISGVAPEEAPKTVAAPAPPVASPPEPAPKLASSPPPKPISPPAAAKAAVPPKATAPAKPPTPLKAKPKPTPAKPAPAAAKQGGTVVIGTIAAVSNIPDPSTVPYDTCVTFIKYKVSKVVSDSYDGDQLLAVFWGMRKGKLEPAARFTVGQSHRLTIEPFADRKDLARVMQADDTNEYSLTPYWVISYAAE